MRFCNAVRRFIFALSNCKYTKAIQPKLLVMRKISFYLFAVLAVFTLATSCTKDPEVRDTPKTEIPDDYVGKWIIGNVNPNHFASYDGTRQDDMMNTIAYTLRKDGTAEQFIYIYEENDDKQTLTWRKGTLTFDEATATLKFNPTQGKMRIFENGSETENNISGSGLYPKYAPAYRNCTFEDDGNARFLVATNDYNETVGFAKANW
jgi:hypothetical protein